MPPPWGIEGGQRMARRRSSGLGDVFGKGYWREADARVAVDAWERSGQSVSAFARRHGLQRQRLSRWASRLKASERPVGFHPVRLVGDEGGGGRPEAIEVVLGDGLRVRVAAGFSAADLERVLAVLEGRA